jgi:hypothetical protein
MWNNIFPETEPIFIIKNTDIFEPFEYKIDIKNDPLADKLKYCIKYGPFSNRDMTKQGLCAELNFYRYYENKTVLTKPDFNIYTSEKPPVWDFVQNGLAGDIKTFSENTITFPLELLKCKEEGRQYNSARFFYIMEFIGSYHKYKHYGYIKPDKNLFDVIQPSKYKKQNGKPKNCFMFVNQLDNLEIFSSIDDLINS